MQKKEKIYIGLVGEKLGGKDTVAKLLPVLLKRRKIKARVATIRFSDILAETLDLWGIPKTRENFSKLSPAFVNTYGPSVLADAVRRRAEAMPADIVLLNGVRWWADYKMIHAIKKTGAKGFLVYVTAPVRIRFERSRTRNEKVGEARTPFTQFVRHERARTEIDIPKIGKKSDIIIHNTGTMQDLEREIEKRILPKITGPRIR